MSSSKSSCWIFRVRQNSHTRLQMHSKRRCGKAQLYLLKNGLSFDTSHYIHSSNDTNHQILLHYYQCHLQRDIEKSAPYRKFDFDYPADLCAKQNNHTKMAGF